MALASFLPAALLLSLAGAANACIVKPGGCLSSVCSALPTEFVNPSLDYSVASTWTNQKDKGLKGVAFYKGIFDKNGGSNPPKVTDRAGWLTKVAKYNKYYVNLEKMPIEPAYVISSSSGSITLQDCCNNCAKAAGCVLYLYVPPSTIAAGAKLTTGDCYFLSGGKYKGDGPFDLNNVELGTPNSSTHSVQSQTSNKAPLGYLGGACNPDAKVVDDPHFTGAHGTHFDFNGQLDTPYCLVTDAGVHINAVLRGYTTTTTTSANGIAGAGGKATRSWVKEVGLVWGDGSVAGVKHTLKLTARAGKQQARGEGFLASAELDGAAIAIPGAPGASFKAGDLTFSFVGVSKRGWYDVDIYSLVVDNKIDLTLNMRVAHPKLQTPNDAHVHFNLIFDNLKVSEKVHGVLGQTYRDSPQQLAKAVKFSHLAEVLGSPVQADGATGKGFLDGSVQDYVSSSVLAPDCKVSTFAL